MDNPVVSVDGLELSVSEVSVVGASTTEGGTSEDGRLRPHLARLTAIKGVKGAIVLNGEGHVLGAMLPHSFDQHLEDATHKLHAGLIKLADLSRGSRGDVTQLFRYDLFSVFVQNVGSQVVVLILEHDTNLSLLRVGLRVFGLKLEQGMPESVPSTAMMAQQNLNAVAPGNGVSAVVNAVAPSPASEVPAGVQAPIRDVSISGEVVGARVIRALRLSLESHTKNGRADALVTRVLGSMNLTDDTVGSIQFGKVVESLARFVRDMTARSEFFRESYETLMRNEMRKQSGELNALKEQLELLREGIGICGSFVTPSAGMEDRRDEVDAISRLGELMAELGNIRATEVKEGNSNLYHCDLLSLGDRLLTVREELQYAAELQHSMVPVSDVIEHRAAIIAAHYRPTMHCGGDWWSMRSLSENRLMVVIADVTGHGAPSAILTGVLKGAWDQIPMTETSPSTILKVLNDSIFNTFHQKIMSTCAVSIVDLDKMEFRIASAGHNFPYLVRDTNEKKNKLYSLLARGNALGACSDPQYEVTCVPLEEDDLIVWYTDGLTECMNRSGTQFGDKKFRRFWANAELSDSPQKIRDTLLGELVVFCDGQALDDDLTLVIAAVGKNPNTLVK